ncbi:hypothetical protein GNP80_13660 [Aliivibrio fischeri]|uniref:hypothetical protein n=1 Tax=Aliivibrio fischeri TaxID=668 RepID=UPI0012DA4549|nr:hypothetical protein [Aliivibrio fischeri]MUK93478.1 hypothetical protein [Aliivibrio fischeri]
MFEVKSPIINPLDRATCIRIASTFRRSHGFQRYYEELKIEVNLTVDFYIKKELLGNSLIRSHLLCIKIKVDKQRYS